MSETQIEIQIVELLQEGLRTPNRLAEMKLSNTDSAVECLADLCGTQKFEIFQRNPEWNTHKGFMKDLIGGMIPDIVLRSTTSGQNRIYIEVKESACLHYNTEDSQIIRYFLHLLAVSERNPKGCDDIEIGRAVILAAPLAWFEDSRTGTDWRYFLEHYRKLARLFCITLGEVHTDTVKTSRVCDAAGSIQYTPG